jgi:hypothetical protein
MTFPHFFQEVSYDILSVLGMQSPATLSVVATFTLILDGLLNAIAAGSRIIRSPPKWSPFSGIG